MSSSAKAPVSRRVLQFPASVFRCDNTHVLRKWIFYIYKISRQTVCFLLTGVMALGRVSTQLSPAVGTLVHGQLLHLLRSQGMFISSPGRDTCTQHTPGNLAFAALLRHLNCGNFCHSTPSSWDLVTSPSFTVCNYYVGCHNDILTQFTSKLRAYETRCTCRFENIS